MNEPLFGIPGLDAALVLGVLVFFGILEVINGFWHRSKRTSSDWIQEFGSFAVLSIVIKPLIVASALLLGNTLFPNQALAFSELNFVIAFFAYLLIDDVLQYWYHRSAHEYPFLWKLHRAHHQAEEMGFFVSYRNAGLYYLIMPNIWWAGIFTYLGGAQAVALGLVIKQLIIIGSHSTVQWDKFFYRRKFLNPIISVLERIIITPAFHHAHHGKTKLDGISDPNGNFGNMFSIWDQLFGTAIYTRKFPTEYGLENDPKDHWSASYLYPVVSSTIEHSELHRDFKKIDTKTPEPSTIQLEKGKAYLYCQCGKSKNQPFCDSSHHGTKFKPLKFTAQRTGPVKLCNCKMTKAGPFCDDSHLQWEKEE